MSATTHFSSQLPKSKLSCCHQRKKWKIIEHKLKEKIELGVLIFPSKAGGVDTVFASLKWSPERRSRAEQDSSYRVMILRGNWHGVPLVNILLLRVAGIPFSTAIEPKAGQREVGRVSIGGIDGTNQIKISTVFSTLSSCDFLPSTSVYFRQLFD